MCAESTAVGRYREVLFSGELHVRSRGDHPPAEHALAVHHRHCRLRKIPPTYVAVDVDVGEHLASVEPIAAADARFPVFVLFGRFEVVTGGETRALTGEDDHPDVRIGDGLVE